MSHSMQVDSLAIFGSVPRGDADLISDKDVLVATDNPKPPFAATLERAGYSPSVYNWDQLHSLARDGSLFLQHLKQESRIVFDRQGRLKELLTDYRPKNDYSFRIAENIALLEITAGVPNTSLAMAWAFDVLAVAIRNHAILQLAQEGQYVFSYSELIARLGHAHQLPERERQLLLDLRSRKREYRCNPNLVCTSDLPLRQTQATIEKITGAHLLSACLSAQDFASRLLELPHNGVHWYSLLRRYEGIHRTMGFSWLDDSDSQQREIELLFAKPSPYKATGSDSISWIRAQVTMLHQNWVNETHVHPPRESVA